MELSRFALAGAILFTACRHDTPAAKDSTLAAAATPASTSSAKGTCPRTGHWSPCLVTGVLDRSGLAPLMTTDKIGDLPEMGLKPATLKLGNAGLAFYVYPDSMARHRAAAALDTTRYIPQAKPVSMRAEATLIQNDNVLAILFSQNEHQRERVSDAITAGPPQP